MYYPVFSKVFIPWCFDHGVSDILIILSVMFSSCCASSRFHFSFLSLLCDSVLLFDFELSFSSEFDFSLVFLFLSSLRITLSSGFGLAWSSFRGSSSTLNATVLLAKKQKFCFDIQVAENDPFKYFFCSCFKVIPDFITCRPTFVRSDIISNIFKVRTIVVKKQIAKIYIKRLY